MLAFYGANARWLVGGFLLALFSGFGQTFFISMWGAEIRSTFGLSHGGFGFVYMAATLASAASLPFVGRLVDRVPIATCASVSIVLLALACTLMAFGESLALLVIAIYLLRLFGQGMMTHTAMTAMGRWYSANRGKAVSFATVGHQGSEALLPGLFVALAAIMGWRDVWYVAALLLLALALPAIFLLMRVERVPRASVDADRPAEVQRQWTRREMLRDPLFWMMTAGVFAPPFIGTSIFFHQDYLIELNGWEPSLYYNSFALMAATTVCVAIATGFVVDRFSAVRVLPFFMAPLAIACLLLSASGAEWVIVGFMIFQGMSYGMSSTLFGALWPEVYGTKHLGSIRAVIVSFMVFMTAAGPGITGALIDAGISFPSQLFAIGIYCLAAIVVLAVVSARLRERGGKRSTEPLATERGAL